MSGKQFGGVHERALEILERGAWGDIDYELRDLEIALALLCQATAPWLAVWENEVSPALDERGIDTDEFELTPEQVRDLGDSWRLAYVARLIQTLCLQYGVAPSAKGPGRSPEGDVTPPAEWSSARAKASRTTHGIARLVHELNDLLDEKSLG